MTRLSARGGVEFDCSGRFQRDKARRCGRQRSPRTGGRWLLETLRRPFFLQGKELTDKQGEEHLDSPPPRRGKARYHTSLA